jgi:predicted DNA-binding protein YlxM (UPF0122 family)
MIHIGTIIKDYCKRNDTSIPRLAAQINVPHQTLYDKIRKNDMALSTLYAISNALNHNFFTYFIAGTNSSSETLLKLSTSNKALSAKVESLQKEVAFLHEINTLLKAQKS